VTCMRDVRLSFRMFRRNPSFAIPAVAVMALGIGATAAVFSVLRGVLLTPLPYRDPSRLVLFRADGPGYPNQPALNREELFALRERTDLFESVAVVDESEGNLTAPELMEAVSAASITDNFFQTLGVSPILGRTVSQRDISRYVTTVNISYDVWQRHFQLDPQIVGREIEVNNLPMRVAGVLPKGFRLYLGAGVAISPAVDVWYPRGSGYDADPYRGRVVIARLRAEVPLAVVRAAVDSLSSRLIAEHPSSYPAGPFRLSLTPLDQDLVREVKPALTAVAGAVAFVLLVACANLTNLLLARASARTREMAVRIAIGASRKHIIRQLAAEAVLLGALGAFAGVILASWSVHALLALAPANLPQREAIVVDAVVAGFAIVASFVCALSVSLIPAWHATKSDAGTALKQDPGSSRTGGRTRGILAASQLAVSLVLLIGAGLMARAFVSLRSVPLGFNPDGAVTMSIALQGQPFNRGTLEEARERRLVFYRQLADEVRQITAVEQAGVGLSVPLKGISIVQQVSTAAGPAEHQAEAVIALAGFLEALQVPLISGRYFTREDDARPVVIVDRRLADALWPQQPPLGRRLFLLSPTSAPREVEVVGVVTHAQTQSLRSPGLPQVWVTYASKSYSGLDLVIRGPNPMAFIPAAKETVQRLGAGRPVHDVRLLNDYVASASADTRFALFVLGAFATLGLILTAIGVYAVVAYATARRAREIAIRLALGADAKRIITLVMRQGLAWIVGGLMTGLLGARILTRYVATLLFNVTPTDPATYVGVGASLALVALAAVTIPALRAVRVDPMLTLKAE
jgi:putative ABC transport system permease protein